MAYVIAMRGNPVMSSTAAPTLLVQQMLIDAVKHELKEGGLKVQELKVSFVPCKPAIKVAAGVSVLNPRIELRGIRLLTKKKYCGNHPGPCDLGAGVGDAGKLKNGTYLEGPDWMAWHDRVNAWLDRLGDMGDITTNGNDLPCKMWVRRSGATRRRYDYLEWHTSMGRFSRPIRAWVPGDGTDRISQAQWVPLPEGVPQSMGYDVNGVARIGNKAALQKLLDQVDPLT
jgi:hypothetical protein